MRAENLVRLSLQHTARSYKKNPLFPFVFLISPLEIKSGSLISAPFLFLAANKDHEADLSSGVAAGSSARFFTFPLSVGFFSA
jgi:hypothetical protein